MIKEFKNIIIVIFSVIGLQSCGRDLAGAGSETTNSLTGMVISANGTPAINAFVRLIPSSYDPVRNSPLPDSMTTITDNTGKYIFHSIDTGTYNIFIQSQSANTRALLSDIHAVSDTILARPATLEKTGAVRVVSPENAGKPGYVYIPGTPLFTYLNNGKDFVILDSVPSGVLPEILYSSTGSQLSVSIRNNITVKPADTTVAANRAWVYYRRLFLNTTITGASINNNIYSFPVLVRLNRSNFNFNEAEAGGKDLKFTSAHNRELSFEIERWDSFNGDAIIWVHVDTIQGNNDRQFIIMYWGNPDAPNSSSSVATFDTLDGFEGVWHLSDNETSHAYDATANRFHGTAYNMSAASAVKGAVGMARRFNGISNYIQMQNTASGRLNFPEDGNYSMSLWVYADTIDSIYHAIAAKGHEQYYMQLKCLKNNKATWEFVEFEDQNGWEFTQDSSPPAPGAKQWVYLTGVRCGTKQLLYINGEKVIDTPDTMKGSYPRITSDDFIIGCYARSVTIPYPQGKSFFSGIIDEVRVLSIAPDDDCIKLCYMNQKTDDALVLFEK